jgi:hypothetical protein
MVLNGNQLEMIDEEFGVEISIPTNEAKNCGRVIKVSIQRCFIFSADRETQPADVNYQALFKDQKEVG